MSLRVRLAVTFAFVALITAGAVALVTPSIVGRGFALIEAGDDGGSTPRGGQGPGPMAGRRAQEVQRETTITLIVAALVSAVGASVVGFLIAGRLTEPLERLGVAAAAVAQGDLERRSGLADRGDEIGSLGRSFDAMADALEQAAASRQRFFQDVVHELKTPLTVIETTTTAVLDGVYAHEDRHLQTIRDQSRLLTRTVDDLRTISRAEAGDLPLRIETIAVDQLVAETVQAFAARADASGIRLDSGIAPGLVVRADRDRLRQVLGALLDNAIRHTPPHGTVVIEGRSSGHHVIVGVRDSGSGIAAADLPHLFDRFYQADPARDGSTGTSGLGLSIVKAIIDAHGGTVGAESPPDGGALFWFELRDPARLALEDTAGSRGRDPTL